MCSLISTRLPIIRVNVKFESGYVHGNMTRNSNLFTTGQNYRAFYLQTYVGFNCCLLKKLTIKEFLFNTQNFCIVDIPRGSTMHTGRIVAFPLQQWFSAVSVV